jgi:glycosyltransferase involved in cell wall biosynthesis
MQKIIFVSRGLTLEDAASKKVLKRIDYYSRALNQASGLDTKVEVYVKSNHFEVNSNKLPVYPSLEIVPISNSTAYLFHFLICLIRRCLLQSKTPSLLIAGDPWKDALIVFALKKILWWAPIYSQISIHGDLVKQESSLLKRIIKKAWLRISLKDSDSIRVVSDHLIDELVDEFGISRSKMIVAPIPVSLREREEIQLSSKHFVGFVGRLHYERGLNEFIEIISKLSQSSMEFDYLIVGDGPDRVSFLEKLYRIVGPEKIDYRGFLNEDELSRVWRDCKILLSTAPSEGYGLALRESLLNGTFVVARKNAGTLAAQNEFGYGIHVYRDTDEAVTLIESLIKEAFPAYDIEEIRLQVLKSNEKSLNSLIDSWLRFS